MTYNQILSSNVTHLQDESIECYDKYIKQFRKEVESLDVDDEDAFMSVDVPVLTLEEA